MTKRVDFSHRDGLERDGNIGFQKGKTVWFLNDANRVDLLQVSNDFLLFDRSHMTAEVAEIVRGILLSQKRLELLDIEFVTLLFICAELTLNLTLFLLHFLELLLHELVVCEGSIGSHGIRQ